MSLIEQETQLTAPIMDVPLWSENFALSSFDPESGVRCFFHLGRWRKDLTIWREIVLVLLADGSVLAHRAYGNGLTSPEGPGGANFAIRVVRAGRRLTYHFLGGAHRVTQAKLREGLLQNGPSQRMKFDLAFESNAPIWDLGSGGDTYAGKGHIEQPGRVMGTIEIGKERIAYDGMGNRDHSMGARDLSTIGKHQWLQGYFENGLTLLVYDVILRGQTMPTFSKAAVYDGEQMYAATVSSYPFRIDDVADVTRNFGFTLSYTRGVLQVETTRILNTAYLLLTAPNETYIGVSPLPSGKPLTLVEQSAHFSVNGSVSGYGCVERTIPGEINAEGD